MKPLLTKTFLVTFFLISALASIGQESIVYTTGFESAENFTAGTIYNNTTIKYDGPASQQWGTFYGTASTTGAISGSQSMQMRWYTSAPGNLGYTFTDFDLNNVSKVTFLASSTRGLSVTAYYSTDGGLTYTGDETFALSGTPTTYTYNISATGEHPNVRIKFEITLPSPQPGSTSNLYIDDIAVYAITGGNIPPSITNIIQSPSEEIVSTTTVSVSADVTDPDGTVEVVELRWGVASDALINTINMPLTAVTTYSTVSNIPAQVNKTTVYYQVFAEDNEGVHSLSSVLNYKVIDPATATIPYYEPFDADLGDCYTYSVSGATKYWEHGTLNANGYAQMNGFNSGEIEEDWLILPGFVLNNDDASLSFDTWYRFGLDDVNNYLKLYYSNDYSGIGNPTSATWTELAFNQPAAEEIWESSGTIDLSGLSGNPVYIGFKYRYEPGNYRWWQVDNISVLDVIPPQISNVVQSPHEYITSSATVSVSADVTSSTGNIEIVELRWGTASNELLNTIAMPLAAGNTYSTVSNIPAQANNSAVYYRVFAEDNLGTSSLSSIFSYEVLDPATTTLPYYEPFDVNLGDCYAYSVLGATKYWEHGTFDVNGYAQMNGFNSGDIEEDWLILPGIVLNNDNVIMYFDNWYRFGIEDVNNYLKLYYSNDYFGTGSPASATWTEIPFNKPTAEQTWTSSGIIDLSALAGNPVWIGFKYLYQPGNYRGWQVDNITIEPLPEPGDPAISVSATSLYNFGSVYVDSLSNVQFYYVSATDLQADLIISAPANFMVSLDCHNTFTNSVTLNPTLGLIDETRIYVRFKPGTTGNFSGSISHTSLNALTRNLSVSGSGVNSLIPAGYYNTATGIEGDLKTQLHQIIRSHNTVSYTAIWNHFENTDQKYNGKVWDNYSDIQCSEPPYEFTFGVHQDTGESATVEGLYYNREHSWPTSWLGDTTDTMYTDLHQIYPADKWVNSRRDNWPYGKVNDPSWTSQNGSKLGSNSYGTGYSGTAFEPIDEYKGDFARTYFYMVTRYNSKVASWASNPNAEHVLDGTSYPAFEAWALDMLLEWHYNDPVSQKEIDRNNAIYAIQGNRNPFIDNPQFVTQIWGEAEIPEPHGFLIFENIQSWTSQAYGNHTQQIQVGEGTGIVTMTDCLVSPTGAASGTGTIGFTQMRNTVPSILELPEVPSVSYVELNISAFGEGRSIQLQRKDGLDWVLVTTFSDIGSDGVNYRYDVNIDAPVTFRLTSPSHALKIHDIIVAKFEEPTQVVTPVITPDGGTYYSTVDVEITTTTPNTTLHYSTISETGPWTLYTGLVSIDGNTTLWAYATDNDAVLDDSQVASAVFTFPAVTEVADIATLRSQIVDGTTVYKLTEEAFLTYQQAWRNQKFIQDATAGILIDDPDAGEITTLYNIYDGITGITGTLATFNNMLRFTPISDPGVATSIENTVNATVLDIPTFTADFMQYQSMLVTLQNVQFMVAPETLFLGGETYNITDGENQCAFRATFYQADYINTNIPVETITVTGIANSTDLGNYITARNHSDFGDAILFGDVNNDGILNVLDLVWLIDFVNGYEHDGFYHAAADVNNDGEINIADITALVSLIMSAEY